MTFSSEFVYEKLQALEKYTGELNELLENNADDIFFKNSEKLHVIERLVQLLVDGIIDINQHFIRELDLELPEDLQSSFIALGDNEIIPKSFAEKIAPVVGVRNILVHQYNKLDKELFIRNLRKHFSDFKDYQHFIVDYLESHDF